MPVRSLGEEIVFDPDFVLTPSLVLAMWAAGMAMGTAAVAWWRIVGPGFFWTLSGATLLVGAWTTTTGPGPVAAVVLLVVGSVAGGRSRSAALAYGAAGIGFLAQAIDEGGALLAVTGTLALGGVTCEMLLGHWYLVNPQMPRWALRSLDVAGGVGLALDATVLLLVGLTVASGVVAWAFIGLSVMSVLLMVGVWFSLNEPSYTGVMAATGLSYLAVLTSLGAVVAGRSLVGASENLLASLSL